MGFFDFFKRRKKKKENDDGVLKELGESAISDKTVRTSFIESNCETIVSANKQMFDSRKEYEVVTSYLSDIQKLDMAKNEEREEIKDSANRIINLNNERLAMQHTPAKITMAQRLAIAKDEDKINDEIKKLTENEEYLKLINKDMALLTDERDNLKNSIEKDADKTEFNKKLLTMATAFLIVAIIFLIYVGNARNIDITYVFSGIVVLGALMGAYFLVFHKKTVAELKENEKKLERAVTLLNKTKIKCVFVTNLLDYDYEKYHIKDAAELKFNLDEYERIVEEEKRFKKAEELIDFYNEDLKARLKKCGVLDTGIWVYQCNALVDPGEMVEVRHRLNVRRQKLRQTIDYNNTQKKNAIMQIKNLTDKHPEYAGEVKMIADRYGLADGI